MSFLDEPALLVHDALQLGLQLHYLKIGQLVRKVCTCIIAIAFQRLFVLHLLLLLHLELPLLLPVRLHQVDLVLHELILAIRQLQHVGELLTEHAHVGIVDAQACVEKRTLPHVLLLDLRMLILHHVDVQNLLAVKPATQLPYIVIDRRRLMVVVVIVEQICDGIKLLLVDEHDVIIVALILRLDVLLIRQEDTVDEVRDIIQGLHGIL